MVLKKITCSGANEFTEIAQLVELCKNYSRAEIGVQVSGVKCSKFSARYWWLHNLYNYLIVHHEKINVALHINADWVEKLGQGVIAPEIAEFLTMQYPDGTPFISRVQLNFKIGREKTPNACFLIFLMNCYPKQRFILSCNQENKEFLEYLHDEMGLKFDCLYDESHGEGLELKEIPKPKFAGILQGYSGGISPENVWHTLDSIRDTVYNTDEVYIDAEGKLKGEDGHLSLAKCEEYLRIAHTQI